MNWGIFSTRRGEDAQSQNAVIQVDVHGPSLWDQADRDRHAHVYATPSHEGD